MTESIIVYRNPVEQTFWESGMAVPLFSSLMVLACVVLIGHRIFETLFYRFYRRHYDAVAYIVTLSGIGAAIYTFWKVSL